MSRALLITLALAGFACSSAAPCTTPARVACDLDAGGCVVHQTCVASFDAIDPCPAGAVGCCFQVCTKDTDCSNDESCAAAGYCAAGRCVADAGP
jgi:hypothetical protein